MNFQAVFGQIPSDLKINMSEQAFELTLFLFQEKSRFLSCKYFLVYCLGIDFRFKTQYWLGKISRIPGNSWKFLS